MEKVMRAALVAIHYLCEFFAIIFLVMLVALLADGAYATCITYVQAAFASGIYAYALGRITRQDSTHVDIALARNALLALFVVETLVCAIAAVWFWLTQGGIPNLGVSYCTGFPSSDVWALLTGAGQTDASSNSPAFNLDVSTLLLALVIGLYGQNISDRPVKLP